MFRKYGTPPYTLILLHGGPGAIGTLKPIANELSANYGVLEHFQSGLNIDTLVDKLHKRIMAEADPPVTLIGHSWGAWLSLFFISRHRDMVKKTVLVGCPPFEDKYVPLITDRRMARLSVREQAEFRELMACTCLSENELSRLERLTGKTDNYRIDKSYRNDFVIDKSAYGHIWKEAAAFRSSNGFAKLLPGLSVPVCIIHGKEDPHPLSGITEPMERASVGYTLRTLTHCGHSPFLEIEAKDGFYAVLHEMIRC